MKILFVDDDPDSVMLASMEVQNVFEDTLVNVESSFDDAVQTIGTFEPDVVILDLLKHSSTGEFTTDGFAPLESLWNTRFTPIVVYSAESSRVMEIYQYIAQHPLVELVDKGFGSEEKIVRAIRRLLPFIRMLTKTRSVVETQLSIVLRDVVPLVLKTSTLNVDQKIDAIGRASFRRLSALSDDAFDDMEASSAWERYLVPPVSSNLLLGDILVKADAPLESVDEYRLILSPSCDLVATQERVPKVNSVLVAKCCLTRVGLQTLAIRRRPEDIKRRILSQGFYERMLPLPALVDVIPDMMANLTDLELIPFDKIGNGPGCEFKRVASVSSPFRELVGWAYIQTAGRPGLPETNLDLWSEEIAADAKQEQSS